MFRQLVMSAITTVCVLAAPEFASADQCSIHYPEAEKKFSIPSGLLEAIGIVETGSGGKTPNPWALNIDGQPLYAEDREAAAQAVSAALDVDPTINIDIGCMQVSWRWHKTNASSPDIFLDPRANVFYAGWYLAQLKQELGSWKQAVGAYHSRRPEVMEKYRCLVYRALLKVSRIPEHTRDKLKPAITRTCSPRIADQFASSSIDTNGTATFVADRFASDATPAINAENTGSVPASYSRYPNTPPMRPTPAASENQSGTGVYSAQAEIKELRSQLERAFALIRQLQSSPGSAAMSVNYTPRVGHGAAGVGPQADQFTPRGHVKDDNYLSTAEEWYRK